MYLGQRNKLPTAGRRRDDHLGRLEITGRSIEDSNPNIAAVHPHNSSASLMAANAEFTTGSMSGARGAIPLDARTAASTARWISLCVIGALPTRPRRSATNRVRELQVFVRPVVLVPMCDRFASFAAQHLIYIVHPIY
jgi:hypothetical protein